VNSGRRTGVLHGLGTRSYWARLTAVPAQNLVVAGEVLVQSRPGDAAGRADIMDRDFMEATLSEELCGRAADFLRAVHRRRLYLAWTIVKPQVGAPARAAAGQDRTAGQSASTAAVSWEKASF
jgi:hypothetical protein